MKQVILSGACNVLLRDPKFTPIPLPNKTELKNDVQQYSRKLRLREFVFKEKKSEEQKSSDDSIIKNKSAFNPPTNKDKILEEKTDTVNSLNFTGMQKSLKSNHSKLELGVINDLKNDKNREIK